MKHFRLFLAILLLVCIGATYSPRPDEFWISFSGPFPDKIHPPGGPWTLMKIDALGNVLIPPTVVVRNGGGYTNPGGAGAALFDNGNGTLSLWIPTLAPRAGLLHHVYRAVIDKRSLRLIFLRETGIQTVNRERLGLAQRGPAHFLADEGQILKDERVLYVAHQLSATGALDGQHWLLTAPAPPCGGCGMGLAAAGRTFFFTSGRQEPEQETAMLQPLDDTGHPKNSPYPVARARHLYLQDVSDQLSASRRYVLYSVLAQRVGQPLFLQVVDTTARMPVGDPIGVGRISDGVGQAAVIDRLGRFVVFCSPYDFLVFQALDATGHPSGGPRVIANDVYAGVDILMGQRQ